MKQSSRKNSTASRTPKHSSSKKSMTKHPVAFEYFDPSATIVTLVGDFNHWDPKARALKRDPGGLWKATIRLEPGTYSYKFVVNGERWEEDPLNLHRAYNEHGTFNSIRKVGLPSEGGPEQAQLQGEG